MTTCMIITMLLITVSISEVTACNDMLCMLADSLTNGFYSWIAAKDIVVVCPLNSVTCHNDKLGYSSLRRILMNLDEDYKGDDVIDTTWNTIQELRTHHMRSNMILNLEQSSISYIEVWDKWTESSG